MRIIVTGGNGTVAPVLIAQLEADGHSVVRWRRDAIPPDNGRAVEEYVAAIRPGALFHLAMGSPEWAETLARSCARLGAKFVYTSSVCVFSGEQRGPFRPDTEPQPRDDYGRYKLDCERRALAATADAVVARLGWQIGDAAGSNNMVDFLARAHAMHGRIEASENWIPACSFLRDTASTLAALLGPEHRGIYHLDANPGLSFFEIAKRLNTRLGEAWQISAASLPVQDQRMLDPRVVVTPITARL